MNDIFTQANLAIRETTPYQAGKPIEEVERELGITNIIKLASNENPLGGSPMAIAAAKSALDNIQLYPDASYLQLRTTIAKYNNVDVNMITVGNGSENCIEFLIKTFLNTESNAIVDQYCFATIQIQIKAFGAELRKIPSVNYRHNIDETIKQVDTKTKIIFVVNPNNPTGTYTTHNELVHLLNNVPKNIIIVVDEAYFEYVEASDYPRSLELITQYPNLIISRTFSKVFGLAGLRLGYLITSTTIADLLNRARMPFNVNNCALVAGIAALGDHEFLAKTRKANKDGLAQLEQGFTKLNIEYIPSVANFITIDTKYDGVTIFNQLLHKGIIVRPLLPYGLPQHLRITIGSYEQNERLLNALEELLHA